MGRVLFVLAVLAAALALAGCGTDPPEAGFTATPTSGEAPLVVTFTDASTNEPTSWQWDFGDGGSSTEQSPTHEYEEAGTYTVTLTAANDAGSDDAVQRDLVMVTPPPNPVCTSLENIVDALEQFTDLELSADGIEQARALVAEIRAELENLRAAAGGEYGDEIAKIEAAYTAVNAAIDALQEDPAQAVDEIGTAAGNVVAALTAAEAAVAAGCS
jgi:hypothetical protein